MNNRNIELGIVGTGVAAKAHAKVFQSIPGVRIAAIIGRSHQMTKAMAKEYNISWCPTSLEELLESNRVNALVIAVPPFLQPHIALAALQRGKHILCEKPLGVDILETQRVVETWRGSKQVGMINFCYRLVPQFEEFKIRLSEGLCGHINSINAEWILSNRLDPSLTFHWKGQKELGGGVLQNFGIQVLDYLFYDVPNIKLLGAKQEILTLFRPDGQGDHHRITGDEITTALFDLGKGTVAYLHLSLVTMPPVGHRVIARGSKGTLEFRNLNPHSPGGPFSLWHFKNNHGIGECLSSQDKDIPYDLSSLFTRLDHKFIEAIRYNDLSAEPSLESALKAFNLVNQIQRVSCLSVQDKIEEIPS